MELLAILLAIQILADRADFVEQKILKLMVCEAPGSHLVEPG